MTRPLAIDLCAGLGGWTEGLLLEGFDVIGFDIERHRYGSQYYPAQLVLQDILTLDGRQFRGYASLIVASPPCQRYSYMAMPWTRGKDLITWHRDPCHPERIAELNALFGACLRIGREAGCPIVIENVRGAIPWVGRSRWNYGSFHLWGDVPALMPITLGRRAMKEGVARRNGETNFHGHEGVKVGANNISDVGFNVMAVRRMKEADDSVKCGGSVGDDWFAHHNRPEFEDRATKNSGGPWFNIAHNTISGKGQNPDGRKGEGGGWFHDAEPHPLRTGNSKSSARKAASARIAKIPLTLARHIARTYYPR